jgi:hypothetical protein
VGRFNPKFIIEAGEGETLCRYLHQSLGVLMEKIGEQKKVTGATQVLLLADCDGLTFSKASHIGSKSSTIFK